MTGGCASNRLQRSLVGIQLRVAPPRVVAEATPTQLIFFSALNQDDEDGRRAMASG